MDTRELDVACGTEPSLEPEGRPVAENIFAAGAILEVMVMSGNYPVWVLRLSPVSWR